MKCLQCNLDATENGETYGKIKIRVCADGHRTAPATAAMNKQAAAWIKEARKNASTADVLGLETLTADEKERQENVDGIVKRGMNKAVNI